MKVPNVPITLIGIALLVTALGCSTAPPAEVAPTPNIDATVEARGEQEVAVSSTPIPQTDTPKLDAITEDKVGAASSDESFQSTNVTAPKRCTLSGGGTVESGWSGNDTGHNHCSNCFCSNGALGCTKMACRVLLPTSGPEPRTSVPTDKPSAGPTPVAGENHIIRLVGNDVGDIAPDFSVLLTNGETVSSSDIRSKNTPMFLFFFSPF